MTQISAWRCEHSGATGYMHTPEPPASASSAAAVHDCRVLLCLPPGPEFSRLFVALGGVAAALSGAGCQVLRLELPGCGNAAADPAEVRLAHWFCALAAGWSALDDHAAGRALCRVAVGARLAAALLVAEARYSARSLGGCAAIAPLDGAGWTADLRATNAAMVAAGARVDGLAGEAWNSALLADLQAHDWSSCAPRDDGLLLWRGAANSDWQVAPIEPLAVSWCLPDLPAAFLPTVARSLSAWAAGLAPAR
ncbi:MAG: hypothetical protein AAF515_04460 [Pseudomonadota bacterium]